jgi:hypothetical protein
MVSISNDILGPFEDDKAVNVRDLLDLIAQIQLRIEAHGLQNDAVHDDLEDLSFLIVNYY